MLIPETVIHSITIMYSLFALLGAYFIASTAYTSGKRKDHTLLRARAFLNESFLKENWMLLFLMCIFFLVHTVIELNEIFGLSIKEDIMEFTREMTELGIAQCIFISAYKWHRLMNPAEHPINDRIR